MLKCIEEVGVHVLYFFANLFSKHLTLNYRVVLLRICGCNFLAVDTQLKNINRAIVVHSDFCQWAQLLRNMRHEGRLNQGRLDQFLKDVVSDLVIFELTIDFDAHGTSLCELLVAAMAEPFGIASCFNNQIFVLRYTPVTIEINSRAVRSSDLERTNHSLGDVLNQALRQLHHATEVGVGLIKLQHSELWIVTTRQSFITKNATNLKDSILPGNKHTL